MVQAKKMNEELFAKMLKELTVVADLIRARQEEKQGILDEFESETKRFFFGRISEKALASSVKKTNLELKRLDAAIREEMSKAKALLEKEQKLVGNQSPIGYKATLEGIFGGRRKAKPAKKKVVKKVSKKVAKKKPMKKTVAKKKVAKKVSKKRRVKKKK
jgi:hypothetical protein